MASREETSGAMKSVFGELVYCTECYAVVGETDECLCLVEPVTSESLIGCGRTDRKCCGGGCG